MSLSPALLGSAVPTFQGRLEYKGPRAKCFIREKKKRKKAVPFCRTQGCPANTEVPLFCVTEQSGKGRNVEPGLPNGKKLLQTVSLQYVQSTLSQRHRYKTHNNIKNKQEQMGPWLHPTSLGGHNQAEIQSHPSGGGDSG